MDLVIGANVSFTKEFGLIGSVNETLKYNANTFMFYTGSNRSRARGEIDDDNTNEVDVVVI